MWLFLGGFFFVETAPTSAHQLVTRGCVILSLSGGSGMRVSCDHMVWVHIQTARDAISPSFCWVPKEISWFDSWTLVKEHIVMSKGICSSPTGTRLALRLAGRPNFKMLSKLELL